MASAPVTVIITYQAQPGKGSRARDELAALINEVVAKEPACLGIRLYQDPDDDTRILLYEQWTDRETYAGPHMQTPHIGAFMSKAREFLAGPPAIAYWTLATEARR
jgi:quinol monooxygenase YgiN